MPKCEKCGRYFILSDGGPCKCEVKLRLAIRDLYRGDGGPLNDLDQGWNDGVDAAAEIFSAENAALEAENAALRAEVETVAVANCPSLCDEFCNAYQVHAALVRLEAELAEAVRKEREACLDIVESCEVSVGNSPAGELAAEWTMDALRGIAEDIRARGDAPEYPSTADDEATQWRHGEKI